MEQAQRVKGLVSIVMPTYNQEQYISEAIHSILNQTYGNIELIIVNDCSTDDTPNIIRRFKDKRIRAVNLDSNCGTGHALNFGFALARGEYETWFASDNTMYPDMLATLLKHLESRPDVDFVYGNFDLCWVNGLDGHSDPVTKNSTEIMDMRFNEANLLSLCNIGVAWVWRHGLRTRAGGTFQKDPCEDYDMYVRMSKVGKMQWVNTPALCLYRQHNANMTIKVNEQERPVYHDMRLKFFEDRIGKVTVEKFSRSDKLSRMFVEAL